MKKLIAGAFAAAALAAGGTAAIVTHGDPARAEDTARAWVDGIVDGNYGIACDQLSPSQLGGTSKLAHDGCVGGYASQVTFGALEVYVTVRFESCTENGDKATCRGSYKAPGAEERGAIVLKLERLPELGWRIVSLG